MKLITKFIALAAITTLLPFASNADVIVLKNGTTMTVYNIEQGKTNIFYTTEPSSDAMKKVAVEDVFAIKIGDGELVQIGAQQPTTQQQPTATTQPAKSSVTLATPDADNASIISQYSANDYSFDRKPKKKQARNALLIYRFTENSILSTPDIEITFRPGYIINADNFINISAQSKDHYIHCVQNKIEITNKRDYPIYIDLANCAASGDIIEPHTFYDGSQVTEGGSSSTGVAMGLGLFGVGGSSTSSSSITKTSQRVMMIAPHGKVTLPVQSKFNSAHMLYQIYEIFSSETEIPDCAEKLPKMVEGEKLLFTDKDSPIRINYILTYSSSEDLSNTVQTRLSLYANQVIGMQNYLNVWAMDTWTDPLKKVVNLDSKTILGIIKIAK